jgi:hypothetical protein
MADVKNTYRTVTPYLVVPDADAELRFLKGAFEGTEVECHRNPDKTVMHAEIAIGETNDARRSENCCRFPGRRPAVGYAEPLVSPPWPVDDVLALTRRPGPVDLWSSADENPFD